MDAAAFEPALGDATGGAAGTLRLASERAAWPLALARAEPVCGPGWVLLGDAAHVVHPLAGQGLNLGLADVRALAEVLAAREPGARWATTALLRRYARARAGPTRPWASSPMACCTSLPVEAAGGAGTSQPRPESGRTRCRRLKRCWHRKRSIDA